MALHCITLARLVDHPFAHVRERVPQALVWLQMGTDRDVIAAQAYAAKEGYTLYLYPTTEPDPLGKAKHTIRRAAAMAGRKIAES